MDTFTQAVMACSDAFIAGQYFDMKRSESNAGKYMDAMRNYDRLIRELFLENGISVDDFITPQSLETQLGIVREVCDAAGVDWAEI